MPTFCSRVVKRMLQGGDAAAWRSALRKYNDALGAVQKKKTTPRGKRFKRDDVWYVTELPANILAREPEPFMTQPELSRLMTWKLNKGKFRPGLQQHVDRLDDDAVKKASMKAFAILKKLRGTGTWPDKLPAAGLCAAVGAVTSLKGVGPATASAMLAAYDPRVPFMCDEALEAWGCRQYTMPVLENFARDLQVLAGRLNEEERADDSKGSGSGSGAATGGAAASVDEGGSGPKAVPVGPISGAGPSSSSSSSSASSSSSSLGTKSSTTSPGSSNPGIVLASQPWTEQLLQHAMWAAATCDQHGIEIETGASRGGPTHASKGSSGARSSAITEQVPSGSSAGAGPSTSRKRAPAKGKKAAKSEDENEDEHRIGSKRGRGPARKVASQDGAGTKASSSSRRKSRRTT